MKNVFVPSTGFFSIYNYKKLNEKIWKEECFRPLNGVLFYLQRQRNWQEKHSKFSSPQRGSFLSTKQPYVYDNLLKVVFVPSTGFFSIYGDMNYVSKWSRVVFVPSTGFFSIYLKRTNL